jgi:hypothetical protein
LEREGGGNVATAGKDLVKTKAGIVERSPDAADRPPVERNDPALATRSPRAAAFSVKVVSVFDNGGELFAGGARPVEPLQNPDGAC